jgi:hypothetical protein
VFARSSAHRSFAPRKNRDVTRLQTPSIALKPVDGGQNTPPAAVPGRAFDLLSVEMPEVLGVISQQIGGIPVNRG